MPTSKTEERVLIMAPVGRDAKAMAELLQERGWLTEICGSPPECAQFIAEGAGALLLTEEALGLPEVGTLLETLQKQPPWSELPLIVLTSGGESRTARLLDLIAAAAGGLTLLERPMSATTLWRAVEVALRSRRRQYQVRDLLEVRSKLSAIVEFSDDAIIGKDLTGVITSWNRGAQNLFGYTADEIVGQSVTLLIPPDRIGEEPQILARLRKGLSIEHYETIRCRKDGTRLDISLTVSPVRDEQGKVTGISKIARDISGRKRTEEALARAQAELLERAANLEKTVAQRTGELRAINEQLEEFVYSIAHDLRAPLRSMIGFPEMLLTEYAAGLSENAREMLRRIQRASHFMDKLLVDLLTYGRTARSEISLAPVPVQRVWKNALFQCAREIEERSAQIETAAPLPVVEAHEATLGQCLVNLLSNALKFIPAEVQPRIRFSAEPRDGFVRLWVEDNGIGIPADQHERIFKVFERVHGSRYPGTGIGLSIVRKGIERMGGHAGVESAPAGGSRFWIELRPAA